MPFRQYSVFLIFSIRNEIDFTEHQWPTRPTCNIFSSDLHMFQLKLAPPEVSDFVEVWEKCSKVVNFNLKEGQIDLLSKVRPRATQKKNEMQLGSSDIILKLLSLHTQPYVYFQFEQSLFRTLLRLLWGNKSCYQIENWIQQRHCSKCTPLTSIQ